MAADMAAAHEAAAAAESGPDAAKHRAAMTRLVTGVRQATGGWLQLPQLERLRGRALEAALRAGVPQALRLARTSSSHQAAETALQQLSQLAVTADVLEATGVAVEVKRLRKHPASAVAAAAAQCVAAWRQSVEHQANQ